MTGPQLRLVAVENFARTYVYRDVDGAATYLTIAADGSVGIHPDQGSVTIPPVVIAILAGVSASAPDNPRRGN